ncbi:MAG: aminotransferase class I/II-fold pyridoxal phosphate-dependent enzyme, partial [Deltaproteobacteria bacterium]|nr:aminotransferase class I/II-fold pyridoxal phosphate-dependent enzyme [Deltaproteobacteria bacterium]
MAGPPTLSQRGADLLARPPLPAYIAAHFENAADMWSPEHEGGYIPLCIAENTLMWDELQARFAAAVDVPARALGYDAMIGAMPFREQLAAFLGPNLFGRAVQPQQLAVLAGAGTVLEIVGYGLADEGEGVLVPTPSYAGFWADLETRDGLRMVPVRTQADEGFALTTEALEHALQTAECPVKVLLFTTPDNPLGRVYSGEEIDAVMAWAASHDLHVIVDEIYGLSVFGERPFVSVASRGPLGDRVHVVWAFSKDFGASGLRCGVLLSENEELIRAVDALAYWGAVSGDTQVRLGELVSDGPWVADFVVENQRRLGEAYAGVARELAAWSIPHVPSDAGFFTVCDLREVLEEPTWEAEHALWQQMLDVHRVNLTPG